MPHIIGRHVHAKARPDDNTPPEPPPTGIDYLRLIEAQHTAELAERVQYAQLPTEPRPDEPLPHEPVPDGAVLDEPVPDGHVRGKLPLPGTGPTGEVSA